ncbi:MAG TPA: ATP-binding cassette domain-containing protein [Terrimicrobiaceae bacterium]
MDIITQNLLLQVEGLQKRFDDHVVLAGVDLAVQCGSIFSLLGPSGAGKSVFLKCLANVMQPDAGQITFDGRPLVFTNPTARADFRRRCSFLFQNNALFDSLSALENVALPLEQTTDLKDNEIRQRSREALRQLEIDAYEAHYPAQLSGGMQKRLALARAIVTRPELVFFDEPTAGLDPLRRNAVFAMITKYQRQFRFTALIVTHDVVEALVASDRVALLDHGQICFEGTPAEFSTSTHPVVCGFRDSAEALSNSLAAIRSEKAIHFSPA